MTAVSNSFPRCQGFGDREGRCAQAATTPARIWCWDCETKRRARITAQMQAITQLFEPAGTGAEGPLNQEGKPFPGERGG